MRKLLIRCGILSLLCLAIAGCDATANSPYPAPQGSNSPYPPPESSYPSNAGLPPPNSPSTQTTQMPLVPVDAPAPESGKASISGVVYSFTISRIIPKTLFYLTHGEGPESREAPPIFIGPQPNREDISAFTDDSGQFSLANIPPGNYFLVVSAPYSWSPAIISSQNTSARLIELKPDQKQPLGVVYVSWP